MSLKISMAFVLGSLSLAVAADVTLSGVMQADMATYFDKEFSPTNAANHDVTLGANVQFDERVAVELFMAGYSTVLHADGSRTRSTVRDPNNAALVGDEDARWPLLEFYGIAFTWEFTDGGTFIFGDLTYSAGQPSFYRYRNPALYGSIIKEQYLRGVGFHAADGVVYLGYPDRNSKSLAGFASYAIPVIERTDEKLVITPSGDMLLGGGGRHRRYTLGTEMQYSRSKGDFDYAVSGSWGTAPFHGTNTHAFLIEPSLAYGDFSLASGFWHVELADKNAPVIDQVDMPNQRFAYVEPGVTVHPKLGLGLSLEWHDRYVDVEDDETFFISPNAYLYPAPGVEVNFWMGYAIERSAPNATSMGIVGSAEF